MPKGIDLSFHVYVIAKPSAYIVGNTSPVYISEGTTLKLQCNARGWPIPNITWITNGSNVLDINQHNQFLVTTDKPGHSMLTILSAFKAEEGIYICMAKSLLGEDKISIDLIVRGNHMYDVSYLEEHFFLFSI